MKMLTKSVAVLGVAGLMAVAATVPSEARMSRGGAAAAGFAAGAVVGAAAASSYNNNSYYYGPGYAYEPGYTTYDTYAYEPTYTYRSYPSRRTSGPYYKPEYNGSY